MAPMKMELEKFDGHSDFGLWQQKMKAILVQNWYSKALVVPKDEKDKKEATPSMKSQEMDELAYSLIILNLANNVL